MNISLLKLKFSFTLVEKSNIHKNELIQITIYCMFTGRLCDNF
jgi:hypothetical protein